MDRITRKAHADSLITYLGMETGQIDLAFDEQGHCQLGGSEEQSIELWFAEGEDAASIYISTVVGGLNDGDRTFILAEAMRANLYWRGTNGATISLGPEDEIFMHTEIPVEGQARFERLERDDRFPFRSCKGLVTVPRRPSARSRANRCLTKSPP